MPPLRGEAAPSPSLAGLRILLVEDEGAISLLLETLLQMLGCRVVAIAASLEDAMEIGRGTDMDIAVLDVNIAGEPIYPFAEQLRARGIPIVFSTGYGAAGLSEAWRGTPVLLKPFTARQFAAALAGARRVRADACAGADV
jgi:CheY-like chemotaxis protein